MELLCNLRLAFGERRNAVTLSDIYKWKGGNYEGDEGT